MSALTIQKSIEETIAMEVASYSTSKRLQIYSIKPNDTSYCIVDFSRHENSPIGQVTATRYSYNSDNTTIKHHGFVLKTRQAVNTYVRILNIFHGEIVCFLVGGEPLPDHLEDHRTYLKAPKVIQHKVLCPDPGPDMDSEAIEISKLVAGVIWDLVANH